MIVSYSNEVKYALDNHLPIVALESTIITHGMPYPTNIETAKKVEQVVRDNGATPATIAFIDGVCHIGLEDNEFDLLVSKKCIKISRRDIPAAVAKKLSGGTTVAATMIMANLSNIKVFATGGIGGVHKEATKTFDISADLDELSKTNVLVVCAGPKAILDIPLTLEYLETKGVVILGYKTDNLPLFYSKSSNYKVDYNCESPKEIASIMHSKDELNIDGGILVTNPIDDKYSLDNSYINEIIEKAQKETNEKNIKGKEITPFLLDKISKLTNGISLESNIALILSNAKLAALIAVEYSKQINR